MARGENPVVTGNHPARQVKQLNTQTDEDKLIAYLNDPDAKYELSKKLKHLLERYELARDVIKETRSYNKAVSRLVKKEWNGETISQSTARRDLDMAQRIFGANIQHNRKLNVDFLLEDLKKDADIARAKGDMKAVAGFRKLQLEIINEHMGDSVSELYKELQFKEIIVDFIPESLNTPLPPDDELARQLELLKKRKGSSALSAEDVSFEDVGNGE